MRPLILGAGLTGSSAAYHLGGRCRVMEQENSAGGLCRSEGVAGFTFDRSGHLLHFRSDYGRELAGRLLGSDLVVHRRRSAVLMRGRFVPYPVQANLGALPYKIAGRCLEDYRAALREGKDAAAGSSLADWMKVTFGESLAEEFFLPYGRKFWRLPMEEMDSSWARRFVPVPSAGQVEEGARGDRVSDIGYNVEFAYPRRGGAGALVDAVLRDAAIEVECGSRVVSVSPRRRMVTLEGGEGIEYEKLISTVPLPELIRIMGEEAPATIRTMAQSLRANCVYNVNMGVQGKPRVPWHWIYVPEPGFCFYRVGFYSNFSETAAPHGMSSLYAEVAHREGDPVQEEALLERVVADLVRAGLIGGADEVVVSRVQRICPAYTVPDRERAGCVDAIMKYLAGEGVLSTGRYGRWDYTTMEQALLDGRDAALWAGDGSTGRGQVGAEALSCA